MIYRFLIASSFLILSACSNVIDGATQKLTVLTPGAKGAVCYVHVDDVKYRFRPPDSHFIKKTYKDLIVDCLAPGNRRKKIVVEATIEDSFYANAANAGGGAVWDFASQAMFTYPEIVEVNFTNDRPRLEGMPSQNNLDIKQPEEYGLEEFLPSSPRLNSDKNQMPVEIQKRERSRANDTVSDNQYITPDIQGNMHMKGNLEGYGEPSVESDASLIPLHPGE